MPKLHKIWRRDLWAAVHMTARTDINIIGSREISKKKKNQCRPYGTITCREPDVYLLLNITYSISQYWMEINTHTHYSFTDEVKKRVKIVDFRSMITTRAKCSYAKKSAQARTWVVVPQR